MKDFLILIFFVLVNSLRIQAQSTAASGDEEYKKDTEWVSSLNKVSQKLIGKSAYDSAVHYVETAYELAKQLEFKRGMKESAKNFGNIGVGYDEHSDYARALEFDNKALDIFQNIADTIEVSINLGNIGIIYYELGNYPKALENYLKALTIAQKTGNKRGVINDLSNMGIIYFAQGDYIKSNEYNFKALAKAQDMGDKGLVVLAFCNIGSTYEKLGDQAKAIEYSLKSLTLAKEITKTDAIVANLQNLGNIYSKMLNYPKALEYYNQALILNHILDDKGITSELYSQIGSTYIFEKKYPLARAYLDSSLNLSISIRQKEDIRNSFQGLVKLDTSVGNYKIALKDYQYYIFYRDSLVSDANIKKMTETQMTYDFDRKTDSAKAAQEKKDALAEAEMRKQNIVTWSVIVGLILMFVFAGFILRSLRTTRKQKLVIEIKSKETEHQKILIEEKNKDILDSITYAKRLQEAILPPISLVKKYFPESFLLYKPKDIVAGDFYWMERTGDFVLIAAADCTGHGVPGALVSVVCSNALNRTVKEFHITQPGKILDKVTELVLETFEKSERNVQDGMDISLCCMNTKTNELLWSGAYNPLWYVQEGKMHEIQADKQPIGKHDNPKPFNTHQVNLGKGDILYLFTDGYADQFGGPEGKKFKYKRLEEKIMEITALPLPEQQKRLESILDDWKGELEQVDDILVIGIRV